MTISDKVKKLTNDELAQATYLHHKNWMAARAKIPKPSLGSVRKDGTQRRFIFQETRHCAAGEIQVYLDTLAGKNIETTYSKDPLTGHVISSKKIVDII